MNRLLLLLALAGSASLVYAADMNPAWQPTTWLAEKSLVSTSAGWKAIVSLERGRLVYFGPAGRDETRLFATARRDDPAGWGGHRLWLGPQANWSAGWPPPAAWESHGAESFAIADGRLRLVLPEAGDGWPRLIRTYHWNGARLVCGAEMNGGTRSAQIIHIVQVPLTGLVDVTPRTTAAAPLGYVQLPSTATPRLTTHFTPPPHVTNHDGLVTLRHLRLVQKLGFPPQSLIVREPASSSLTVSRGALTGSATSEPDDGFFTQVYLGGAEPFIELEQLSPMFTPGTPASFAIELTGTAP